MSPQIYSPVSLNTSARSADRVRAEWKMVVSSTIFTPREAIEAIADQGDRRLHKITLRSLFMSTPGWGRARTDELLGHVLTVTDSQATPRQMTVGWLADHRNGPRRWEALMDALNSTRVGPWQGFPFTGGEKHHEESA